MKKSYIFMLILISIIFYISIFMLMCNRSTKPDYIYHLHTNKCNLTIEIYIEGDPNAYMASARYTVKVFDHKNKIFYEREKHYHGLYGISAINNEYILVMPKTFISYDTMQLRSHIKDKKRFLFFSRSSYNYNQYSKDNSNFILFNAGPGYSDKWLFKATVKIIQFDPNTYQIEFINNRTKVKTRETIKNGKLKGIFDEGLFDNNSDMVKILFEKNSKIDSLQFEY